MSKSTPRLSSTQRSMLLFLSKPTLAYTSLDGHLSAEIKIRTMRPLLKAGLVGCDYTAEQVQAAADGGGWIRCFITDAGREAVAS